jgi:hypothetical protein
MYERVRFLVPKLRQTFVAITFAEDEAFTPLQTADLLASLCRLEAGRHFHREYYEYMRTFIHLTSLSSDSNIKWCSAFFDKKSLDHTSRQRPSRSEIA